MTTEQRLKNISVPNHPIDVVLDTDAYNEIDDQFAIAYLLSCKEKLNTRAIYAAPFLNEHSKSAADGMEQSYNEILKLLDFMKEKADVYRGSDAFLTDEKTPIISDAAKDLAERARNYSPENPLYVIAIGAITNVASAILLNPEVAENTVVVWLGGHALHYPHAREFNLYQDIAAARVVMGSGVPFVLLPCRGVVSSFTISSPELEYWFKGKNKIADYLATHAINVAEEYAANTPWTRCIWDVTAVAWLMNDNEGFMEATVVDGVLPTYDNLYEPNPSKTPMGYVYHIKRDFLMDDMIKRILKR